MLQACHLVFNILIMLTFLKQDAYICAVVGNCQIYVLHFKDNMHLF